MIPELADVGGDTLDSRVPLVREAILLRLRREREQELRARNERVSQGKFADIDEALAEVSPVVDAIIEETTNTVKVTDFGQKDVKEVTVTGLVGGTLNLLAPLGSPVVVEGERDGGSVVATNCTLMRDVSGGEGGTNPATDEQPIDAGELGGQDAGELTGGDGEDEPQA